MAPLAHPNSGLAVGWSDIPSWEKGSKVSDSSDDGTSYWDSSDVASDTEEVAEGVGVEEVTGEMILSNLDKTPRSKSKVTAVKGSSKVKGSKNKQNAGQSSSIKYRPRAPSMSFSAGDTSLSSLPNGDAALSFSSWTKQLQESELSSSSCFSSATSAALPASASLAPSLSVNALPSPAPSFKPSFPLRRDRATLPPNRRLQKTVSAPANVLIGPGVVRDHGAAVQRGDLDIEDADSDSDFGTCRAASIGIEELVQRAYETNNGNVSLE